MNRTYSKSVIHYFTGNSKYAKTTNMYSSVHEVKTMNRIKIINHQKINPAKTKKIVKMIKIMI